MKPLYKTTIVIWTDYEPIGFGDDLLSSLACEAEVGDAYCSSCETKQVEEPSSDPNWDGTEFFGVGEVGNLTGDEWIQIEDRLPRFGQIVDIKLKDNSVINDQQMVLEYKKTTPYAGTINHVFYLTGNPDAFWYWLDEVAAWSDSNLPSIEDECCGKCGVCLTHEDVSGGRCHNCGTMILPLEEP